MTEVSFEREPWEPWNNVWASSKQVDIIIMRKHVEFGMWSQFRDPVSLAIKEQLNGHSCAQLFWNSDGFRPQYHNDTARIGIHTEIYDEDKKCIREDSFWIPLPQRTTRAMWKLYKEGIDSFKPVTMRTKLPVVALD